MGNVVELAKQSQQNGVPEQMVNPALHLERHERIAAGPWCGMQCRELSERARKERKVEGRAGEQQARCKLAN